MNLCKLIGTSPIKNVATLFMVSGPSLFELPKVGEANFAQLLMALPTAAVTLKMF